MNGHMQRAYKVIKMDNINEIIKDHIINVLMYQDEDIELDYDDNLLAPGLLDSLKILQLVHFVENRFKIQIPQEDVVVTKFGSIEAISNYLRQRQQIEAAK